MLVFAFEVGDVRFAVPDALGRSWQTKSDIKVSNRALPIVFLVPATLVRASSAYNSYFYYLRYQKEKETQNREKPPIFKQVKL